jgi:hypothetical protein
MGKRNSQYIHNLAITIMGQAKVSSTHYNWEPKTIWTIYGSKIVEIVGRMSAETRGRIAACGTRSEKGLSHWDVAQGEGLNQDKSGDELLTLLAAQVVTSVISDVIHGWHTDAVAEEDAEELLRYSSI